MYIKCTIYTADLILDTTHTLSKTCILLHWLMFAQVIVVLANIICVYVCLCLYIYIFTLNFNQLYYT